MRKAEPMLSHNRQISCRGVVIGVGQAIRVREVRIHRAEVVSAFSHLRGEVGNSSSAVFSNGNRAVVAAD